MVSIDVDNLFRNVQLSETIGTFLIHFFNQSDTFMNMTCDVSENLLELSVKSSFFSMVIFISKFKVWVWVCPIGPTIFNIFKCFNEII